MKFLEIVNIMNIKEHEQVWSISLFDKKTGSGVSVNEQLAKELHKPVIKNFKEEKPMPDVKTIFDQ